VASAFVFRSTAIPWGVLLQHWAVVVNLLAGSLIGAWLGAAIATRLAARTLYRVIAILLISIALLLAFGHDPSASAKPIAEGMALLATGLVAGLLIGMVAALLGVAGGEFLIPTLVLIFGIDIKLAGSLSLAVSLPTMLVGFARYSGDQSFAVLGSNRTFILTMAGSIIGTYLGAQLVAVVSPSLLIPLLAAILVLSALKVWRHG
jgi:uncharacterized protein